jgi:16S rRNA processing protein RimM
MDEPVVLGRISGLYGVKGWIKVFSFTDPRQAILGYTDCLLKQDGRWNAVHLAEGRKQGKSIVARIEGIDDRDTAAELVGADIGISRDLLPETGSGEYYWADLEGLQVLHRDGRVLGKVAYVLATGANDVLVVQGGASADQEILIPFLAGSVILDVDVAAGVINVDWEWD